MLPTARPPTHPPKPDPSNFIHTSSPDPRCHAPVRCLHSLGSAFFSLLAPGARLRPHCGPTNARLRAHLGLIVPEGDCAMRVGSAPPRR